MINTNNLNYTDIMINTNSLKQYFGTEFFNNFGFRNYVKVTDAIIDIINLIKRKRIIANDIKEKQHLVIDY